MARGFLDKNRLKLNRKKRQAKRAARLIGTQKPAPGFPDNPEKFLDEFCFWPHRSTGKPATGLNTIQRTFLRNRAGWRWDEKTGDRLPGRDIVLKARQCRMTSLGLGLTIWALLNWSINHGVALRGLLTLQTGKATLTRALWRRVEFCLERLPWANGFKRTANELTLPGGGVLTIDTAGSSEAVASLQGRSGTVDIWLASESAFYRSDAIFAAVGGSLSPSAWVLNESTAGEGTIKSTYHAREFFLTEEDRGSFHKAHFFPWWVDETNIHKKGSPDFKQMMKSSFSIPAHVLEEEKKLGLTKEQIAFRRRIRLTGGAAGRRRAIREFPESAKEPYTAQGETWLDGGALEIAKSKTVPPVFRERLGALFSVSIWDLNPAGFLVLGVDVADGRDNSAVVARDARTLTQVFEIHGKCLASELAQGIAFTLKKIGKISKRDHLIVVEANRGKAVIGELKRISGLNLFSELKEDRRPGQKRRKVRRFGIYTTGYNRPRFLDALAMAYEGTGFDPETNEPTSRAPTVETFSRYLVDEVSNLTIKDDKVAAHTGHDDLAIADAICLWTCPQTKTPGKGGASISSRKIRSDILRKGPV